MGYHAVGVAVQDMALGLDFLKEMAEQSSFPWLSANLRTKSTSAPIFKPSTIVDIGSLQIGLLGLTGKTEGYLDTDADAVVLPWKEVLPALVNDLSAKTDMLILLSNLSSPANKEIAKRYNIHIIVQSGTSTVNMAPTPKNNTLICQTGKQGKYIGIMKINWELSKTWGDKAEETLARAQHNLDRYEWQLSRYSRYTNPQEDLKDSPAKLRTYRNIVSQRDKLRKEIEQLTVEAARQEGAANTPATFRNQFMAMKISLQNDPTVQTIVEGINQKINEAGSRKTNAANSITATYAGWHRCKGCHEEIVSSWRQTQHGRAFSTLEKRRQQFNLDCLPCHVTGITKTNTDLALSLPTELQNVGCESCHGAAKQHVANPDTSKPVKRPQESVCLQCHTDEHDDSFDYQRDSAKVHAIGL